MFFAEQQSGSGDAIVDFTAAIGNAPWYVIAILIAMIASGFVILALKARGGPGPQDH